MNTTRVTKIHGFVKVLVIALLAANAVLLGMLYIAALLAQPVITLLLSIAIASTVARALLKG